LQQPLFDMMRSVLPRAGPNFDWENYSLSVKIWLLWLQPWRAVPPSRARGSRMGRSGKYTERWRSYVSANLHFYTTLFTLFLKTMSQIDNIGNSERECAGLFSLLSEVLDVFSDPMLVDLIEALVVSYKASADSFGHPVRTSSGEFLGITNVLQSQAMLEGSDSLDGGEEGGGGGGDDGDVRSTKPVGRRSASGSSRLGNNVRPHRRRIPQQKWVEPRDIDVSELFAVLASHQTLFPDGSMIPDWAVMNAPLHCQPEALDLRNVIISFCRDQRSWMESALDVLGIGNSLAQTLGSSFEGSWLHSSAFVRNARLVLQLTEVLKLPNVDEQDDPVRLGPRHRHCEQGIDLISFCGGHRLQRHAGPERKLVDGRLVLTERGRDQLLYQGRRLGRAMICAGGDALESPPHSDEWFGATQVAIALSHRLNKAYGLPLDPSTCYKRWQEVFFVPTTREQALALMKSLRDSFRFNLRFLGGVRSSCLLLWFLISVLRRGGLLGSVAAYAATAVLAVFAYRGKNW
jgi:hypothetical protein